MNDGKNLNSKDYVKRDITENPDSKMVNKQYESMLNEQRNKIQHIHMDDNIPRFRNESPTIAKNLRIISNSPNRLEKPNFFGVNTTALGKGNNVLGGKSNINSNQSPNRNKINNFDVLNNKVVINSPKLISGNSNIKPVGINLTNSLNSIFNAFSNSSVMKPMNKANKLENANNKDNTYNSNGNNANNNNSPQYFSTKKSDLINAVSSYMSNKDKSINQLSNNNNLANNIGNITKNLNDIVSKSTASTNITNPVTNLSVVKPIINASNTIAYNSKTNTKFCSVKEYAYKEEKNLKFRNSMEDFEKIVDPYMGDNNYGFFSLYDGHGGADPVKYVKERMPELLSKFIEKEEKIETALTKAFHKVDDELKFCDSENTGTTACVVLVIPENGKKTIYSANVGDTKCLLISRDDVKRLSYDHKCSDSAEVERVKQNEGIVFNGRVFGQLVLTRALGDHALKKYGVISTPYVSRIEVEENHRFVVMASDGVWDVITEEDALNMSKKFETAEDLAYTFVKSAIKKGSKDNISCIIIKVQ